MKNIIKILTIGISAFLFSCTSSQYVQTNKPLTEKSDIEIILEDQEVEKDYEVIGFIETSGWIFNSNKSLTKGLMIKGKKVGADAVIEVKYYYIPHLVTGIPSVSGIAVKYK